MKIQAYEVQTERIRESGRRGGGFERRLAEMVDRFEKTAFVEGRPETAAEHWARLKSGLRQVRENRSVEDGVSRQHQAPRSRETPQRSRSRLERLGPVSRHLHPSLRADPEAAQALRQEKSGCLAGNSAQNTANSVSRVRPEPRVPTGPRTLMLEAEVPAAGPGADRRVPSLSEQAGLQPTPSEPVLALSTVRKGISTIRAVEQKSKEKLDAATETPLAQRDVLKKRDVPKKTASAAAAMPDEEELRRSILRIESMLNQIRPVRI